ncbi:MAG: immune inhibitor A [candidate division Zixibacteria bacterium]|nr:immune inhibitor A [candidate division Zixibacteria bacterium]
MRVRFLTIIIAIFLTVSAGADIYKQIRVLDTSSETITRLSGFDIVDFQPDQYIEIIADSLAYNLIKVWGLPIEIIHEDLTAFYQSRYPVGTTMGGFRTYSETMAALDSLASNYPALVAPKVSIGQTHEGRDLWMVKVSDNPGVDENEPEIFIDGLHHAREPVTVDICVEFIKELSENYGIDPDITDLVDNNEFFIVPIVNPDGYEYNRQTNPSGGGMWRKNRRNNGDGSYGVDPNRNYPYFWGYDNSGSSGYTSSNTYRGPTPGSEPEIQALMSFIESHDFAWIQNFHSYSNLCLWSWGYYDGINENVSEYWEYFGNYAHNTMGYAAGTAWQLLYNTNGDANDWAWGERQSKRKVYAITHEVGNSSDGFWPSLARIPVLINENVQALLNYSNHAYEIYKRRNPQIPAITSPATAPADQSFYIHWQTADIDTFNATVSYYVVEKTGYQQITNQCEQASDFELESFALSTTRKHSGSYSIYSGQGNGYRAIAELKERLKIETGDTLTFWTWYDIETDWDYAYVEISTDGGYVWYQLDGNRSTSSNPNNHNEEFGITGSSGGWVLAQYSLADYAGQEADIRFRYWTDDVIENEGIYIDDIYPYDSFASTTILTEYAYQESLQVGPYSSGEYTFRVSARDDRGDLSPLSNRFKIEVVGQFYSLSGYVALYDTSVDLTGSIVTISDIGLFDTTDIDGYYSISGIQPGVYNIAAAHDEYADSLYPAFAISSDTTLDFMLQLDFLPGDANGDGSVIGSDITYLAAYFKGQNPAPAPFLSGDANGDCQVIGSDIVYLIAYFRGSGNPPVRGDCP